MSHNLFLRNLARVGKPITPQSRETKLLNGRPTAVFTDLTSDMALVRTVQGVTVFDSTNTETAATHRLCLRYRADLTAENYVLVKGTKRLKILSVENACENDQVLVLLCTERGDDTLGVNKA
jgi:head-tail adaptor